MLRIVNKCKDYVIILKPVGMSSQSDNCQDCDVMSLLSEKLRSEGEDQTLYPIHRLDKVVGGLLVYARNKKCASELSKLASSGILSKKYLAVVAGEPEGDVFVDYLIKNSVLSKAVVANEKQSGAKYSELEFNVLETVEVKKGKLSLVDITLKTGRFHQIRAQFSSRGFSLVGDKKYGSKDFAAKTPALFAYKLEFSYNNKSESSISYPDLESYPWNMFSKEVYKGIEK